MNDLQDLIATNAIRAYNEGFERGVAAEQERVIQILEDLHPDRAVTRILVGIIKAGEENGNMAQG